MKNLISRIVVAAVLLVLAAGIVFGQGLYWESSIKSEAVDGKKMQSTSSYRPKMFKQSSENGAMIFRLDKEMVYILDYQKKEYTEMTFAEMETVTKQAMAQMEELKMKMKDMPPEQRKAMEKMMGGMEMSGTSKSKITVVNTHEKSTISGFSCIKYTLKKDGKEMGTIWTTDGVADYEKMKSDMKEFSRRLMAQMPNGKELSAAMKKIEGFPVQTTISGMTTTVTKVENKSLAVSEFEVPAGFTKVEKPKTMQ